ncbi:MAG TPA: MFS transporter [Lapillicoccus sp.]|nr:MFS transporter [Lapillicoccus sp.]
MSLLARMDRLPFSRPHYALLVIGGLGYTFDGADNALVAFLLPSIAREWDLDNGALGLLASAGPLGYLVGALVSGTLGDRIGRRPVMMWALAVYTGFTLVAALALSYEIFAAARILAGVGIGAESVIVAPYLAEFVPPARRGWFVGCLAGFFSFGYVAAALLGRFVVPTTDTGWRWAQVVTAVPVVLLLWWRRSLLESPRYLLARGRRAEAERVVVAFEDKVRRATGRALPPAPVGGDDPDAPTSRPGLLAGLRFLWGRDMRRRTAVVWLVWFVNIFAFYGFFTWIPTLLIQQGIAVTRSFDFALVIYLAQIPGYFTGAWLSDRLDRRRTIAGCLLGAAAAAFWLSRSATPTSIMVSGAVLSFFLNGSVAAMYAYTPELFPTWVRTTATGLASAFGRLGSISAPAIIGFASGSLGLAGVFGMTCAILGAGVVGVLVFGVPTAGQSLERLNERRPTRLTP